MYLVKPRGQLADRSACSCGSSWWCRFARIAPSTAHTTPSARTVSSGCRG